MLINISDILPIIIIFQSVLFAFVLLTDNGPKKISNLYLASFLILLGAQFLVILAKNLDFKSNFFFLNICVFGYSYGPLLYLYSKSLIYKSFNFQAFQLLHFIPIALILLLNSFGYSLCTSFGFLMYISLITYISIAIKEIYSYRQVIRQTQSSINRTDLIWLQWTMLLFSIVLLLDIINQFISSMIIIENISLIHFAIAVLINWMFYKGLKQPQIFLGISKFDQEILNQKNEIPSKKIPNDEEQLDLDYIQNFMKEKEVYTNPQLNLNELSDELNIPPRRLSYLINTFLNQNFMGFVNDYRIEKAKFLLNNPKEEGETISEVMYDVGFNSKSSFFSIFKEKTGLTPSKFKNRHS